MKTFSTHSIYSCYLDILSFVLQLVYGVILIVQLAGSSKDVFTIEWARSY